jgi:hypothetical protein
MWSLSDFWTNTDFCFDNHLLQQPSTQLQTTMQMDPIASQEALYTGNIDDKQS